MQRTRWDITNRPDEEIIREVLRRGLLSEIFRRASNDTALDAVYGDYAKMRSVVRNAPDDMLKAAFLELFFGTLRNERESLVRWLKKIIRFRNSTEEDFHAKHKK